MAKPRHACGLVRQTGCDQVGVVGAFVDGHHDAPGFHFYLGRQIQQVAEVRLGLGVARNQRRLTDLEVVGRNTVGSSRPRSITVSCRSRPS